MALIAGVCAGMKLPISGGSVTYGTAGDGGWTLNGDQISLSVVTTPTDFGGLNSITLPIGPGYTIFAGVHIKGLVYDPATWALLAVGDVYTTADGDTEFVLTFPAPVALAAGASYAFGAISDNSLPLNYWGTGGTYRVVSGPYSAPPNPLSGGSTGDGIVVMTLTYTPTA